MINYQLIVPSASRPHLLRPVLTSLLAHVDQLPEQIVIHDDAVFPGRADEVWETIQSAVPTAEIPIVYQRDNPPIGHGPALARLLTTSARVRPLSEFVLYSQDDHVVVRSLPICAALATMKNFDLNQIRFNKRATMGHKGTWAKKECGFGPDILTIADHWYFQTSLWRVAVIKPIVDWWMANSNAFAEHAEVKVNRVLNGEVPEYGPAPFIPPAGVDPMAPDIRAQYQRTFIYGPIGTDKYIEHIGGEVADWALYRPRGGETGSDKDSQAQEGER